MEVTIRFLVTILVISFVKISLVIPLLLSKITKFAIKQYY